MKFIVLLSLFAICSGSVAKDNTITKVVKLLQGMLDKSVKEGDEERKIFAKFQCYCDQNEAEKSASIDSGKEQIALLESEIEETQGDTGGLSSECADLKAKMADNVAAREEALALRNKENKAFNDEKADLEQAIGQMKSAIETLTKVGADQTSATGADNKQFMAGKKVFLMSVQSEVQHALRAASALMNPEQQSTATAFLQSPFTGTYTSQSAVVMGIIKSMRDTFEKNLEDAIVTEGVALKGFDKFTELKEDSHEEMRLSYEDKQKALGGNDGDLATKKGQLADAEKQLASDEEFLSKLVPMCKDKAEAYANRKSLRANEEAAIAEAVSILNSDDAFATFGTTSATSTGASAGLRFVQIRSVRRPVMEAQTVLQKAAKDAQSARLSKVVSLLQGGNPFSEVLDEIDKMLEIIVEEGKADKTKFDWCKKERTDNKAERNKKNREITSLDAKIDRLSKSINNPETGLKKQIADTEESLVQNDASQTSETKARASANALYQTDVRNLVKAQEILAKAIKVLAAYYDDMEAKLAGGMNAFIQEDPNAPDAFIKNDAGYAGQSSKGGEIMEMLNFILKETAQEETTADKDEDDDLTEYNRSRDLLKAEQSKQERNLVRLQGELATTAENLLQAEEELKTTTADRDSIVDYLLKIKPGCDFIDSNFETRNTNRATETTALKKAIRLIKGTPAYKTAVNKATNASYGDCDSCEKDTAHVDCKACMADVTKPAYCAGHKGTPGC